MTRVWARFCPQRRTGPLLGENRSRAIESLRSLCLGRLTVLLLIAVSLTYPLFGTPARLDQRFVGWRPVFGTLNGLDFMSQGTYSWPDDSNRIELHYDWEAIQWLLDHMRGNPVVVESSEVDYYRAGGSQGSKS